MSSNIFLRPNTIFYDSLLLRSDQLEWINSDFDILESDQKAKLSDFLLSRMEQNSAEIDENANFTCEEDTVSSAESNFRSFYFFLMNFQISMTQSGFWREFLRLAKLALRSIFRGKLTKEQNIWKCNEVPSVKAT